MLHAAWQTMNLVLFLDVVFYDVDHDGSHNYLLIQKATVNTPEFLVSLKTREAVSIVPCEYRLKAECEQQYIIKDGLGQRDDVSRAYICTAKSIEGCGVSWEEK